jgi:hypothetical protein
VPIRSEANNLKFVWEHWKINTIIIYPIDL